jgi:hypothetical protein
MEMVLLARPEEEIENLSEVYRNRADIPRVGKDVSLLK